MHKYKLYEYLDNSPLFKGLNSREKTILFELLVLRDYSENELVIKEDDNTNELYIIIEGAVKVLKYSAEQKGQVKIATLRENDIFGELSFIDAAPRSSTIKTIKPTTLLVIAKHHFETDDAELRTIFYKISLNITKDNVQKLRFTSEAYANSLNQDFEELKARNKFGQFFILVMLIFGISNVLSGVMNEYSLDVSTNIAALGYWALLMLPTIALIKIDNYPISAFGITLANWKRSLVEALLISPIAAGLYFGGFYLYQSYSNLVSSATMANDGQLSNLLLLVYFISAFAQEFVARGVIQTSLENFLGEADSVKAVLITSGLFGMFYLFIGFTAGIVAFLLNLLYGLIYVRHRNLIGVSIVHFVLGTCMTVTGIM